MRRSGWLTTTGFAICCVIIVTLLPPRPKLIWNASASVPLGLYSVTPTDVLHVNELVVVRPPAALATFIAGRGYLAMGVPLLKHILALRGQAVCRTDRTITVDGNVMGDALDRDHWGRPLPVWQGCHVIANGEVFLMNRWSEYSLDGRYFGPLPTASIVGRADPLWADKER
jgi:conjugative transfer signal peptidase TraF